MIHQRLWSLVLELSIGFLFTLILTSPGHTEVTLDGSMGPKGALKGPKFQIGAELGRRAGSNLFHSFGRFNIGSKESATFTGPAAVDNVIGRVTGGSPSTINGQLRSEIPSANLWLINPKGVVFGKGAKLDVDGSFHVSTADYLKLKDGARFDAKPSAHDALLTTAPPEAFGFLDGNVAPITVKGGPESALEVPEGKTLSVVGGDIKIQGGKLRAPGGRVNLASVASKGEVELKDNDLKMKSFNRMGDIHMSEQGLISTTGKGGGAIFIRGGQLVMDESFVGAGTLGEKNGVGIDISVDTLDMTKGAFIGTDTFGSGDGGNLTVQAKEIRIEGVSGVVRSGLSANSKGTASDSGDAGDLRITTNTLDLQDGGIISTVTFGPGEGGNLTVQAKDVLLEGDASLLANSQGTAPGSGNAGDIQLTTDTLTLRNGAQINSFTYGPGNGGNLTIHAEDILLEGLDERRFSAALFASAYGTAPGSGDAGDIQITTDTLTVRDGAQVNAFTDGPGQGGNISVHARDILLDGIKDGIGSGLFTETRGSGDAGDIQVTTDSLILRNAGDILATTFGRGRGGDITVHAKDILLEGHSPSGDIGSGLFADTIGDGDAGDIRVTTSTLTVRDGAVIVTSTGGSGQGGNLTVQAKDILLEGTDKKGLGNSSALFAGADGTGPDNGDAGDIRVITDTLTLREGAAVATATSGPGQGGNLMVQARDIRLEGMDKHGLGIHSGMFTGAFGTVSGSGDAGNMQIITTTLLLRDDAQINALTNGSGVGGKITVEATDINLENRSTISAASFGTGESGTVSIKALKALRLFGGSAISVETTQANAGDIDIQVGDLLHLRNDSAITTSVAGGEGKGGNITIDPTFVVLDDHSRIIAQAKKGSGGNINITADFLFQSPDSLIDASSEFGQSGTVTINSPETNITGSITVLPETFFDAAALMRQHCATRTAGGRSSLVVRGGGSVLVEPGLSYLPAFYLDLDSKHSAQPGARNEENSSFPYSSPKVTAHSLQGLEFGCSPI